LSSHDYALSDNCHFGVLNKIKKLVDLTAIKKHRVVFDDALTEQSIWTKNIICIWTILFHQLQRN